MSTFKDYCIKREIYSVTSIVNEAGISSEDLEIWLEARYPGLYKKYNEIFTEATVVSKGDETIVAPTRGVTSQQARINFQKILSFFDRLKSSIDKDYENTLGTHHSNWSSTMGAANAFDKYIQSNLDKLGVYFGTDNVAQIRQKAANVARRKSILKRGDDVTLEPILQGLVQAYNQTKSEKESLGAISGVEVHFNGLKDAVERLKQDINYFLGLYLTHKEDGMLIPSKYFKNLGVAYDDGQIKQRHDMVDYSRLKPAYP